MKGNNEIYTKLLKEFGVEKKRYSECIDFLTKRGFTHSQARNAIYVYKVGANTNHRTIRSFEEWTKILSTYNAKNKTYRECVQYLIKNHNATYSQAKEAVRNYKRLQKL